MRMKIIGILWYSVCWVLMLQRRFIVLVYVETQSVIVSFGKSLREVIPKLSFFTLHQRFRYLNCLEKDRLVKYLVVWGKMWEEVFRFLDKGRHLDYLVTGRSVFRFHLKHQFENEREVLWIVSWDSAIGAFEYLFEESGEIRCLKWRF